MERVDQAIGEVLTGADPALATIAKAVCDVNETLAVHAAWTEKRFEAVDKRLVSLARIFVMTSSKFDTQIAGFDSRLLGFGVGQSGMGRTLSKLEQNQAALAQGQDALQQQLATLMETMQGLTTRVGEVLAIAITDEMAQHMPGRQTDLP
ncbi:hypothetical protein [Allorhizocola rhizosphaerae]|uniref:hypothetical protein n=1 Tax=Allorhizocola rhizosphaerae TaxID=1872709 RepID=UPI0013C2B090|nr:hypothetical protein [Allorhizocola rhizosphaerae]